MSHTTSTVPASLRERTGSRYAKRLRQAGRLPGIVYGHGDAPVAVHVDLKEMLTLLRKGAHVVELAIDGGTTETCLVKDLQFGWLGDDVIHIDFTRVNLAERVKVHVHIDYVGAPPSLAAGAVLTHEFTELAVECAVRDIPDSIRVDLGRMTGAHLNAGEVVLPEGMALAMDPNACITSISRPIESTDATATAESEPEVIGGSKPE